MVIGLPLLSKVQKITDEMVQYYLFFSCLISHLHACMLLSCHLYYIYIYIVSRIIIILLMIYHKKLNNVTKRFVYSLIRSTIDADNVAECIHLLTLILFWTNQRSHLHFNKKPNMTCSLSVYSAAVTLSEGLKLCVIHSFRM